MRLLLDEDVDVRLIRVLRRLGHEVKRVPCGVTNGAVMRLAQAEHRVLVTRDADFSNRKMYPPSRYGGIIHLAIHPSKVDDLAPPLTRLLSACSQEEVAGTLIVLERTAQRIFSAGSD